MADKPAQEPPEPPKERVQRCPFCASCPCCKGRQWATPERVRQAQGTDGIDP